VSYDRYSVEYCLTVSGWTSNKEDLAPEGHVETWEKETYQGSGFGRESSTWRMLWFNPDFTDEQRASLHEKFPFPERQKITDDLFKNIGS